MTTRHVDRFARYAVERKPTIVAAVAVSSCDVLIVDLDVVSPPAPRVRLRVALQLAGSGEQREQLEELDRYLDVYYPAFEAGFLLEQGGVGDQPARYWDLITAIRTTAAAQQAKYDELTTRPATGEE